MEHVELLRAARSVQQASIDGDVEAVHAQLCELRNALVAHLRHEQRQHRGGPGSDLRARLTRHGQERLLRFVDQVLAEAADEDDGGCTCLVRAAELRAMLLRQVRLESGNANTHR